MLDLPPEVVLVLGGRLAVGCSRIPHRRRLWWFTPIAVVHAVFAVICVYDGQPLSAIATVLFGAYYGFGARSSYRARLGGEGGVIVDDPHAPVIVERPAPRPPVRPPPPSFETDPFRASPQPTPLRVLQPRLRPAPVALDPGAPLPQLLR